MGPGLLLETRHRTWLSSAIERSGSQLPARSPKITSEGDPEADDTEGLPDDTEGTSAVRHTAAASDATGTQEVSDTQDVEETSEAGDAADAWETADEEAAGAEEAPREAEECDQNQQS